MLFSYNWRNIWNSLRIHLRYENYGSVKKKKYIDLKTSDNFHVKGEYSGEYY